MLPNVSSLNILLVTPTSSSYAFYINEFSLCFFFCLFGAPCSTLLRIGDLSLFVYFISMSTGLCCNTLPLIGDLLKAGTGFPFSYCGFIILDFDLEDRS